MTIFNKFRNYNWFPEINQIDRSGPAKQGKPMPSERRELQRFSLNLQARVSFRHTEDQPELIETVAANISASGVYLKTSHNFPMASKVKIEFHLQVNDLKKLKFIASARALKKCSADHLWVTAQGVVIRQGPDGVGVIFDTNYRITPMQPPPDPR